MDIKIRRHLAALADAPPTLIETVIAASPIAWQQQLSEAGLIHQGRLTSKGTRFIRDCRVQFPDAENSEAAVEAAYSNARKALECKNIEVKIK